MNEITVPCKVEGTDRKITQARLKFGIKGYNGFNYVHIDFLGSHGEALFYKSVSESGFNDYYILNRPMPYIRMNLDAHAFATFSRHTTQLLEVFWHSYQLGL